MKLLKLSSVLLAVALTGCAPTKMLSIKQTDCEKQFTRFEDVVSCTKDAYINDGMARENEQTKLYFLKGDQLVQKVKKGEITELDARTEWQSLYVDMRKPVGGGGGYHPQQRLKTYCAPAGGGSVVCY